MGKKAPAFTVASLAMSMTRRPATVPMPVTTPAAGAPPQSRYMFQAAHRPSSKNCVCGSTRRAMRSRAVRRPFSCWRAVALGPPPCFRMFSCRLRSSRSSIILNERRLLPLFHQGCELLQRGSDDAGLGQTVGHSLLGLQSVAGDAEDDLFVTGDAALLDELARDSHGHAAGRLGKDAFRLGEQGHGFADLGVGSVVGPAAGFANDFDGEIAIRWVADGQRLGDGVWLADGPVCLCTVLDRTRDGIAAGRLGTVDGAA